jgi:hypothetical protein
MKVFFTKLIFLIVVLVSTYGLLVHLLSSSDVDEHYYKFTQEAGGLILGISRAGEGIDPSILDRELNVTGTKGPIVNFALNKYQSPYGEVYLKAVEKKIMGREGGVYVLSIAPGNFMSPTYLNEQELKEMDQKMSIGKIDNFTKAPNYSYIANCYSKPLYTALDLEASNNPVFHQNGWQEAKLESPGFSITPELMKHWKSMNLREYRRIIKREKVSPYRIDHFKRILEYLQSKGNVFIVRLPTDCEIIADENSFWPEFDRDFNAIAQQYQVPFFNYSERCDQYVYYDGSHMESESARRFTSGLAEDIKPFVNETNLNQNRRN